MYRPRSSSHDDAEFEVIADYDLSMEGTDPFQQAHPATLLFPSAPYHHRLGGYVFPYEGPVTPLPLDTYPIALYMVPWPTSGTLEIVACDPANPRHVCAFCTVAQNPHLLHHHQLLRQRQQQQALLQSQQQNGMHMGLPNGGNPVLSAAQLAAMQQQHPNMRPVNLPHHMQQQQLAAQAAAQQHHQQQQQAQAQHQQAQQAHQQHQQMMAQQLAVHQANAAAQARGHGQQPSLSHQQQMQGLQHAQAVAAAQQHQQQQAQQHQQAQQQHHQQQQQQQQPPQQQPQQPQPPPQQQQQPPPQSQPQPPPQSQAVVHHPQHPAAAAAMLQSRAQNPLKGTFVLQMLQFGDHLSQYSVGTRKCSWKYEPC